MRQTLLAVVVLLLPLTLHAQPAPLTGTTLTLTDTGSHALHVGCPVGSTACIGGLIAGPIDVQTIVSAGKITIATGVPAVTTNALYNNAGGLWFNGAALATGASVSGTTGAIGKFTGASSIGNSIITEAGTVITIAGTLVSGAHTVNGVGIIDASGRIPAISATYFASLSGANLTGIPTSAVSSGNYVATITGGTGISVASGTGNASAPSISVTGVALLNAANAFSNTGTTTFAGPVTVNATGATIATFNTTNAAGGYAAVQASGVSKGYLGLASAVGGVGTVNDLEVLGAGWLYLTGTSGIRLTGNVSIGSANVTDSTATPTIASGFGTGSTIAGKAFAFKIAVGTGSPTTGTVTFNQTYASAPICVASGITTNASYALQPSTTQVIITPIPAGAFGVSDVIYVLCRGY